MNKKGKIGDIVMDNIIYLVLLIIFFAGMITFVYSKMNGAAVWEDYYAKEVAKVIDSSKPGGIVILDVQRATEIAAKNKISNFEEIFQFDNFKSEVCVKLSRGKASCFNYFNSVNVAIAHDNKWVHYADCSDGTTGDSINRLHFAVVAK